MTALRTRPHKQVHFRADFTCLALKGRTVLADGGGLCSPSLWGPRCALAPPKEPKPPAPATCRGVLPSGGGGVIEEGTHNCKEFGVAGSAGDFFSKVRRPIYPFDDL